MNKSPLVSIICLCYNHEQFVQEAIHSAAHQTYKNTELIIIDDGSSDNSQDIISKALEESEVEAVFLPLSRNIGNCAAFNLGLAKASGKYIIDLAADDVLMPERVEKGVKRLESLSDDYGVTFSNAEIIGESGGHLNYHYPVDEHNRTTVSVPDGDVFAEVIRRYFICPPTIMFKKEVVDFMGGYDEKLLYEDFDFWIRSSRKYKYAYVDDVLMKKRRVADSLGSRQFKFRSKYLISTYKVCKKAAKLIENNSEREALRSRLTYEISVAIRLMNFEVAYKFFKLRRKL